MLQNILSMNNDNNGGEMVKIDFAPPLFIVFKMFKSK